MKIFEVTKKPLKEEVSPEVIEKIKAALRILDTGAASATQPEAEPTAEPAAAGGGDPDQMLQDVADRVRSGDADLNQDIDAELGRTGADPQDVHLALYTKIQEAARAAGRQIIDATGLRRRQAIRFMREAQLTIRMAAYGYINKKYLNGDDQNFQGDTREMVAQVLRSQQPRGGAQPAGQQSSARPQGQQGTVPSGGGTNALDAMAADRAERDF